MTSDVDELRMKAWWSLKPTGLIPRFLQDYGSPLSTAQQAPRDRSIQGMLHRDRTDLLGLGMHTPSPRGFCYHWPSQWGRERCDFFPPIHNHQRHGKRYSIRFRTSHDFRKFKMIVVKATGLGFDYNKQERFVKIPKTCSIIQFYKSCVICWITVAINSY